MAESLHWRRVVATLADPDRRRLYARLVLRSEPLTLAALDAAGRRRLNALVAAGLARLDEGTATAADPFGELLRAEPVQRATGPERFLRNGRLADLPRTRRDRLELFGWLADRVLRDEVLDEKQLTRRLAEVADDPVALRRHLIDAGLLVRDPDGRNYRRGTSEPSG